MALLTVTSRLKPIENRKGVLKYQLPPVFKEFVVGCVRDLSIDDRAAFWFWCFGDVPVSKLDVNLESDHDIFKLFVVLVQESTLSAKDVSFLERILSTIGRKDLLQRLKQVELRMFIGNIVEGYVRLRAFAHQDGGALESASCSDTPIDLLVETKTRNMGLIEEILDQFSEVVVDGDFLQICNEIIRSHLSWSGFVAYLVIIGELYSLHSVDVAVSEGYYVCALSGTKTSQLLAEWISENGGTVADFHLHFNENSDRECAKLQDDTEHVNIAFPKYKKGEHTVRKILVQCTYSK
ncbi:hypothetical protein AWC38_SpisGene7405 [Stylophora pistillata]|uniref:DED domain-containing protein n=1 Tax=Stylophora pistillata TaxID=50429 RepID=A0A2B4SH90_STYPI|nr:hypothetical protein AWC38_SpisGene7405 [Stylophora pistillata]